MDLAELQRNLEILESRYSELAQQGDIRVQGLEAELAERRKQSEALGDRIQGLVAEIQASAETQAQLQAELAQLHSNLAARDQERTELLSRSQELEASASQAQAECDRLAEQLASQSEALRQSEERLQVIPHLQSELAELTQFRSKLAAQDQEHTELLRRSQELEASASQAQAECVRLGEQLASQGEALRQSEERLQAIPHLQSELQESRQQAAQLRQVLQEQQANEQALRASVESERSELRDQRARFQEEVDNHALSLRELEVLRTECARRYQALLLSEEQATTILQLERRCLELEETLIQVQSKEHEHDSLSPAASSESTERLQKLEQELKEARNEAELLQEQLFLVQEELEHYFLLSQEQGLAERQPSPASPLANRQEDSAVINSNRGRLLSAV